MRTIFRGGRVFDGTGAPVRDADLVVEDGRIVQVGPGLDGDEAIDATGQTLLPGLFDCHTHIMFSHLDTLRELETPFSFKFFDAGRNLLATLRVGITTIRDAAGADLGVKRAVEDGLIPGPRMQISLNALSQTGGHGDQWMPCGGLLPLFGPYPGMPDAIVDGPEEMRRKVRELIRDGADVIKVCATGGVLSSRDDPKHAHFRMDELETLVAEASAAGLWVMAHAQGAGGIKQAVRAGVRSIEHGVFLDQEAIGLMLERGTYLVPTLVAPRGVISAAEAGVPMPEVWLRKGKEVVDIHAQSFRMAVEAGVKIAMGTDSSVTPHGENLRELELMVDYGMTPTQALVATTKTAAELLGFEDELGTLEAGKRADVVLVDGDPFEFKTLAERIDAVYKDGHKVAGT